MNYKTPLSLWLILLVSFHATHLFADMVKGNPDSKVCHMETCKYANSKGCTMVFENADEAEKAEETARSLLFHKLNRERINTIAQPCWSRSIWKDMPEMRITCLTHYLCSNHTM